MGITHLGYYHQYIPLLPTWYKSKLSQGKCLKYYYKDCESEHLDKSAPCIQLNLHGFSGSVCKSIDTSSIRIKLHSRLLLPCISYHRDQCAVWLSTELSVCWGYWAGTHPTGASPSSPYPPFFSSCLLPHQAVTVTVWRLAGHQVLDVMASEKVTCRHLWETGIIW